MGMLDFLINQGKEPVDGMEYIYEFNMAWPVYEEQDTRESNFLGEEKYPFISSRKDFDEMKFKSYSIEVQPGLIVTNVKARKGENGNPLGYEFTFKDFDIKCRCNYSWAFWENTIENVKRIKDYKKELAILNSQQEVVSKMRKKIVDLEYADKKRNNQNSISDR